jgi:predicted CXXCH cytochrome family protein
VTQENIPNPNFCIPCCPAKRANRAAIVFGALVFSTCAAVFAMQQDQVAPSGEIAPGQDAICRNCHRDIYDRYRQSPMARGSGPALDGVLQGEFTHAPSGVQYAVFVKDGKVWMSYRRVKQGMSGHNSELSGERELKYFIGSGHRGRTYLYEESGLWFQTPINYYSKSGLWDMAPGYGSSPTMPAALPVDPSCLHCHATGVQFTRSAARNRFAGLPFTQGGVGCTACHGDGTEHVAKQGRGEIINPIKLSPKRRDSVCLQCHLEGEAAINRPETSLAAFRAGDDISDHVAYFVKSDGNEGAVRATSQYEALLRSRCKIASGDKLTCTTCHDAHGSPSATARVSYYRGKCLSCHTGDAIATNHHPEQQDCTVCHMPRRKTTDVAHEQATEHGIPERPSYSRANFMSSADMAKLVPVGNETAGDRELGLAYAQLGEGGNHLAAENAQKYLQKAEKAGADDEVLHSQLGLIEQMAGNTQQARKEYKAALGKDPNNPTALGNLAVLDASLGQTEDTVHPAQMSAGLNLAVVECRLGNWESAVRILTELRQFSPDDPSLRGFGSRIDKRCALPVSQTNDGQR